MAQKEQLDFKNIEKYTDKNTKKFTPHWALINNALKNANLDFNTVNIGNNQKIFKDEFTKLICDITIHNNDLGQFAYNFLVRRDGEWIKGEYVAYRCRDLPVANKIKQCSGEDLNCNMVLPPKPKEKEIQLPIALLEVSDTVNDFCLAQVFCNDEAISNYINEIKKNLRDAINFKVEEWVEMNFSNEKNYKSHQIVTIKKNASEREIVKEIRKAYHLLRKRNKFNYVEFSTKSIADNIYGFINTNTLVDYEAVLSCCQNAEGRLGSLYDRLYSIDFKDEAGQEIKNIVGVIFDKGVHPIDFGHSELYEVPCPNQPWNKKQQLAIQVVSEMMGCASAILIKFEDADSDDQVQVDNQLVSYENPTTSNLTYANMKKENGTATAEELGITKPSGGDGTTDTYEITGTDATAKTVNVTVTVEKGNSKKTKEIVIKASDSSASGDQDQVDATNQANAYKDVTSTLTYVNMKKENGTATAEELGITKPSASTGTTDTYTILSKDDDNKSVSVKVDVNKNGKKANKTFIVKGSDAALLFEKTKNNGKSK